MCCLESDFNGHPINGFKKHPTSQFITIVKRVLVGNPHLYIFNNRVVQKMSVNVLPHMQ